MPTILPWQLTEWERIYSCFTKQQMPHAILLAGPKSIGKTHFAKLLVALLLCQHPQLDGTTCGDCADCKLLQAGSHPDFLHLFPESIDKEIRVEQVRQLITELSTTSRQGKYQVVILEPTESLNTFAANALLKTLEEPAGKVVFILVSHQVHVLSATLRSRCQIISFKLPTKDISLAWLKKQLPDKKLIVEQALALAEGIPLKALSLAREEETLRRKQFLTQIIQLQKNQLHPIQWAANINSSEVEKVLAELMSIALEVLRIKNQLPAQLLAQPESYPDLLQLSLHWPLQNLFTFLDKALALQKMRQEGFNLNWQLSLEDLLSNAFYS